MDLRHSISSNIRWLATANLLSKPIWFLFFIFVARILGPEEFGKYMYALSFVSIVSALFESGVDYQTVRIIAQNPEVSLNFVSHSLCLKAISGILVVVVTSILMIITTQPTEVKILIIFATIFAIANSFTMHIRFVFRGLEVMKYEGISIVLEKGLIIVLGSTALIMGEKALGFMESYTCAYVLLFGLTFGMFLFKVGRPKLSINVNYLYNVVLKPSLPFAFMGFFMVVYFFSATILIEAMTHSQKLVGFYNSGYRFVAAFALFPSIIMTPMYPVFSRRSEDKSYIASLLDEAARIILIMSATIAIPCCLFASEVTQFLYGSSFAEAASCFGIIVLSMIPIGFTWVYGSLVAAVGRQTKANYFILSATVLNIVLNYLLIPKMGVNGAAAVTLLTEMIIASLNIYLVRDYINVSHTLSLIGRFFIIISILVVGVQANLFYGQIYLKLCQSLFIMLVGYFVLRIIKINDIKRIMQKTI